MLASAFALFPDPRAALKHWTKYLKPGGIITLDVTHPKNLASGNVIERVASRMRVPIPLAVGEVGRLSQRTIGG